MLFEIYSYMEKRGRAKDDMRDEEKELRCGWRLLLDIMQYVCKNSWEKDVTSMHVHTDKNTFDGFRSSTHTLIVISQISTGSEHLKTSSN